METTAEDCSAATLPQSETPRPSPIARVTWEGCSVLLDINDGDRLVFARLSPNATLKIGNKKCSLRPLLGCPFGSLFRVETGSSGPYLSRCVLSSRDDCAQDSAGGEVMEDIRDNRLLIDNNTAQSLSSNDIDAMRREGATGDEIVEALIANSSTFGKKTVFSQEKYKLKKQKKYAPKVLLRRPSTRSICETYFKKYPTRIGFLRVDTLSLLLSMANVGACSDVLVVDMVGGLVTGAIAERLGGTGYVCSTYLGSVPNTIDISRMFNFSSEECSRIVQASLMDLCSSKSSGDEFLQKIETPKMESSSADDSLVAEFTSSNECALQEEDSLSECRHALKSVKPGRRPSSEIIKFWKENGFTNLIVAALELEVDRVIVDLLPLLSYSAPFAIYHQYLQPLATCMHKLQTSRMAVGLKISEPWLREYQVLPSRTHPHMQMNAFGGYILSGIRICSSESGDVNK